MKARTTRAVLVLAVFALLAALGAAEGYAHLGGSTSIYSADADTWTVFLRMFRYYFAWALVAPGILWLGRRVPIRRERWVLPLAFHVAVPIAGTMPLWGARILLNAALGGGIPRPDAWRTMQWSLLFARQVLGTVPVYWFLLALGAAVQVWRNRVANDMRAATLQRSLAAAQLDALRMKAQPQFLVNTLNTIATLARSGDTDTVVRLIDRLGMLLRLSMETSGRQIVRLEEELALLDEYLAIERIRTRERLHVIRRVVPDVRHALVPNLILQPLAENALLHGLASRRNPTVFEITAHRDNDMLRIVMRDDGQGLPWDSTPVPNVDAGLRNVVERLEGLYDGRSRVELTSDETGYRVVLSVPFSEAQAPAA